MSAQRIVEDSCLEFLERFGYFEDGVITGVRLHLPRFPADAGSVSLDIQAMDGRQRDSWRLVRMTVHGVYEYCFRESRSYTYSVLSDGLNLACAHDSFILDLDPGPDKWSPELTGRNGGYSNQYAKGVWCEYEVLDGPFI